MRRWKRGQYRGQVWQGTRQHALRVAPGSCAKLPGTTMVSPGHQMAIVGQGRLEVCSCCKNAQPGGICRIAGRKGRHPASREPRWAVLRKTPHWVWARQKERAARATSPPLRNATIQGGVGRWGCSQLGQRQGARRVVGQRCRRCGSGYESFFWEKCS